MTISNVLLPACTEIFPRVNADAFTTAAHWYGTTDVSDAYSQHDVKTIFRFLITDNKEGNKLILWPTSLCETHEKMLYLEQLHTRSNMNPSLVSGEKLLQYIDDISHAQQRWSLPGESPDDIKTQLAALRQSIQTQLNKIQQQIRDDKLKNKATVAKSENLAYQAQDAVPNEESDPTLHRARRSVESPSKPLTTSTSYADLWAEVTKVIANVKTNYMDFYGNLLQK